MTLRLNATFNSFCSIPLISRTVSVSQGSCASGWNDALPSTSASHVCGEGGLSEQLILLHFELARWAQQLSQRHARSDGVCRVLAMAEDESWNASSTEQAPFGLGMGGWQQVAIDSAS